MMLVKNAFFFAGIRGRYPLSHHHPSEENLGTTVTSIKERQDDDDVTWRDKGHERDGCWVANKGNPNAPCTEYLPTFGRLL